ncbi:MAG: bile acid:sodium symporter family protein [Cyclobacteriaceae bacterium]
MISGVVSCAMDAFTLLGICVMLFFVCLAFAVRSKTNLKGFSFTILIFAAVSAAMFFPEYFTEIGDFQLKQLIVPLLIIIMFGMGTSISLSDFWGVVKMPKGVIVGVICQFSIMPVIGASLAYFSDLPPEIAAGIILVGCSPSGLASNVMAYISGANLALSLTLTSVATLLAPLMTPLLMQFLADQLVPIDFWSMFLSILKIVILPIVAGLIFNHFAHGKVKWLDKAMPIISMSAIAIIITIITAAGRDSLLDIGLLLIVIVLIHNSMGYLLGYWGSRIVGMDKKSSRTIAFEVGMQNSGLASGIALEMGRVATMGLAPAVFGPLMNITGSSLATWLRGKPVDL